MSSYLVSNKVINQILATAANHEDYARILGCHVGSYHTTNVYNKQAALGLKIHELNIKASGWTNDPYTYQTEMPVRIDEFYELLSELDYQLAEEETVNTQLAQAIHNLYNCVAHKLARQYCAERGVKC